MAERCPDVIHKVYEEVPLCVFAHIARGLSFVEWRYYGRCPECAALLWHRGDERVPS